MLEFLDFFAFSLKSANETHFQNNKKEIWSKQTNTHDDERSCKVLYKNENMIFSIWNLLCHKQTQI